ncbi:MAG: hypothetical protein IJ870_06275 [Alphaproteobacteria bacterium]|nr:hypothetical protein [Alphaproteobacteria bacterium]
MILVFAFFMMDWHMLGTETIQTFVLDSSQSVNIKLDITSSKQNYIVIFPFFLNTILALLNNQIFKYEKHKKGMLSLFAFNLISFVMLISGNNFIQLMTFVFMVDILSQLLIFDVNASKRYSIYNLVADMGLFLVLAMLQSKLVNLDVGNISHYYETGRHRDFIMFVIMLSLAIKFGFFLFQGYWLDLKSAKFHALYFLPYLSTPMAALVLYTKLYPLLVVSPSFLPLLNTIVVLSALWGGVSAVLNPQIKEKFVYCNMFCIAFLVKLLEKLDFVWNLWFSNIVICFFVFNLCLYYLHYELDRGHGKNKPAILAVLVTFLLDLLSLTVAVSQLADFQNIWWISGFGFVFLFVLSHLFVFVWPKLQNRQEPNNDYRTICVMSIVSVLLIYISHSSLLACWQACFVFAFFVALCCVHPMKFLRIGNSFYLRLQNVDLFSLAYAKCIEAPLKHAGLLFNIVVDFIFLERTLWPFIATFNTFLIKTYRHISRLGILYYFLSTLTGILIFIFLFYM